MMGECTSCKVMVSPDLEGRLPAWCPKCGGNLKRVADDKPGAGGTGAGSVWGGTLPGSPTPTTPVEIVGPRLTPTTVTPPSLFGQPVLKKFESFEAEFDHRLGAHNMFVGLGLAAAGLFVSFFVPTAKALENHDIINAILAGLQILTVANGIALCASGLAIKNKEAWGVQVARLCACVGIFAGVVWLFMLMHLGTYDGEGYESARHDFIRWNFDLIVGAIDGIGLLWFLDRYEIERDSKPKRKGSLLPDEPPDPADPTNSSL